MKLEAGRYKVKLAETDEEQALELARQITRPALRAETLGRVARNMIDKLDVEQ